MQEHEGIRAGPVGRVLRLATGLLILTAGIGPPLMDSGPEIWTRTGLVAVGLFGLYLIVHLAIQRYVPRIHPWIGAVVAVLPVVVVFVMGGPAGRLGSLLFVGISLLFTAWRADGGCEVMTLPGMLLGKRTHLVCIAFSPIDWLEDPTRKRS